MVCLTCIKHVDNSILPFIGKVMARGLIFLGSGGNKILPVTFDAVQRGINPENDFVRHRITCALKIRNYPWYFCGTWCG